MKPKISKNAFQDAMQINERVFYAAENILGGKLTLKEAVESRKNYLEKIKITCQTVELMTKVNMLEEQINELNELIPQDEIKEEIQKLGLEHLSLHKTDLEQSIRICDSLLKDAVDDYNWYSRRYEDALKFLEQYDIIK